MPGMVMPFQKLSEFPAPGAFPFHNVVSSTHCSITPAESVEGLPPTVAHPGECVNFASHLKIRKFNTASAFRDKGKTRG